ncbi:MAG: MarP family serine protease [Actinomycetota bacterium]
MNWVDLVVLVLVAAAVFHGIARGAVAQVLTFGGIVAGLALGVVLAPFVAGLFANPLLQTFFSLITVFGVAGLLGGIGEWIGYKVVRRVLAFGLRPADAAAGAAIAVVATLFGVWLIGGMLAAVPQPGPPFAAFHDSKIIAALGKGLPPAPSVFSSLSRFFTRAGFPPVFAEQEPRLAPGVGLPDDAVVSAAISSAAGSTVKILGVGCGGIKNGSGFIAGPGLVVTNAHVVAGLDRPMVQDARGRRHQAGTVLFDPNLDIAILRVGNLPGAPLPLRRGFLGRGESGAVLGYPGGGPLGAVPAAVRTRFTALGRDIYSRSLTRRDVYQLQAEVHPGNSGGPFVRSNGEVVGVVFSVSALDENTSYALTSVSVASRLDQARALTAEVDTGPCAA